MAELDAPSDAAPAAAAEGCPNRAMSALAARLAASVDFRRRLFHLASTAQLPEETLGARQETNSYILILYNLLLDDLGQGISYILQLLSRWFNSR